MSLLASRQPHHLPVVSAGAIRFGARCARSSQSVSIKETRTLSTRPRVDQEQRDDLETAARRCAQRKVRAVAAAAASSSNSDRSPSPSSVTARVTRRRRAPPRSLPSAPPPPPCPRPVWSATSRDAHINFRDRSIPPPDSDPPPPPPPQTPPTSDHHHRTPPTDDAKVAIGSVVGVSLARAQLAYNDGVCARGRTPAKQRSPRNERAASKRTSQTAAGGFAAARALLDRGLRWLGGEAAAATNY